MSLVNELGSTEDPEALQDTEAQDTQALFHRAGLMLRLDKQVRTLSRNSVEQQTGMIWFLVSLEVTRSKTCRTPVVTVIKVIRTSEKK